MRREHFPRHRLQRKPLVSDPGMHHGTCVTHMPWCMSGSLTRGVGKTFPGFPAHAHPAILRIWHFNWHTNLCFCAMTFDILIFAFRKNHKRIVPDDHTSNILFVWLVFGLFVETYHISSVVSDIIVKGWLRRTDRRFGQEESGKRNLVSA